MTTTKTTTLNVAWLKWLVLPVLAFVLSGWVTKRLHSANPEVDGEQLQKTVASSLRKLDSGDRTGALDGLARVGGMAPNDMAVQASLIGKFQAMGEHDLAAQAIERFLRAAPPEQQSARGYASLCQYLLDHGNADGAKRILSGDLINRWPGSFETAYLQGAVALRMAVRSDEIASAAEQLQKCAALDPNHLPSKLQLGIAYLHLGEFSQAESLLRAVQERQPFDPVVLLHLSEVLEQEGRATEAANFLSEHKRVSALQERRQHLESQGVLNQLQPTDLLELGRIYGQLGEPDRAARTLRIYTRRQPADANAQRELAQACLLINDSEGARLAMAAADALDAEHNKP